MMSICSYQGVLKNKLLNLYKTVMVRSEKQALISNLAYLYMDLRTRLNPFMTSSPRSAKAA